MDKKITTSFSIGIDLAKESFDVALAPQGTGADSWRDFALVHVGHAPGSAKGVGRLVAWVGEQARVERCQRIVVESTGRISQRFVKALDGRGLPVPIVVNPLRPKRFAEGLGVRDKTDRIDAAMLALFATMRQPKPGVARTAAEEKLRVLTRLRETHKAEVTGWTNRLYEAVGKEDKRLIKMTLKHHTQQIERLDAAIAKQVEADAAVSRQVRALKTIKGIKQVTATTLTAELGDLRGYSRGQLSAVAGVYPSQRVSGTSVRGKPRMIKGGGGRVRRVLYMSATSLFSSKGPLRDRIDRLKAKGVENGVIIGIMMHKLLLIARAVIKSGHPFDPSKIGCEGR